MKNKTLKQYIETAMNNNNFYSRGICGTAAICVALPETDYHGDIIDPVVRDMQCDACGGNVVYTWVYTDKILQASRQVVKYGKKPGTCDGGDLTPYITKCDRKYWLDEFIRQKGDNNDYAVNAFLLDIKMGGNGNEKIRN